MKSRWPTWCFCMTSSIWCYLNNNCYHFSVHSVDAFRRRRHCSGCALKLFKGVWVYTFFGFIGCFKIWRHRALTRVSRHVLIKKYLIRFFTLFLWFVWLMSVHCRINAFESLLDISLSWLLKYPPFLPGVTIINVGLQYYIEHAVAVLWNNLSGREKLSLTF